MYIRQLCLLLIALVLANLVDEFLAPVAAYQASQIADEDDIYLSSLHEGDKRHSLLRQQKLPARQRPMSGDVALQQEPVRFHLTAHSRSYAPLPLSLFTSLQI